MPDSKSIIELKLASKNRYRQAHQLRLSKILAAWDGEAPGTSYYDADMIAAVIEKLKAIFEFEAYLDQDDIDGGKKSVIYLHALTTRHIAEVIEETPIEAWVEIAVIAIEYTQEPQKSKQIQQEWDEGMDRFIRGTKTRKGSRWAL